MSIQLLAPPLDTRWSEVQSLVEAIRDHRGADGERFCLVPTVAGCGFELASAIGSVVGTSGTLPLSVVSNDTDVTRLLTKFEIGGFSELPVAHALAAHGFYEFASAKGPALSLNSILGIGVTGTIASRDPQAGRRGGQRVAISVKDVSITLSVSVKFRHGSELEIGDQNLLRRYQSQMASLFALNLVAHRLGLKQLSFGHHEPVEAVIHGQLKRDSKGQTIIPTPACVVNIDPQDNTSHLFVGADGILGDLESLVPGKHVLVPTSANPFTPGHDAMALELQRLRVPGRGPLTPVFVVNNYNAEKGASDRDVAIERAQAFVGRWPVLVLHQERMKYFVEMAKRFKLDIAVGGDTPPRMFLPQYCADFGGPLGVYAELKATGVKFIVFPRADKFERMQSVESVPLFAQDPELFVPVPHFLNGWSSTKARAAQ